MIKELIKLMEKQEGLLKELLILLDLQFKMVFDKDVFGLEGVVDKIHECSKKIAKAEVERRKLIENKDIGIIVEKSNDTKLKDTYKKIRETLKEVINKKETNEMILKQNLVFTNKMLSFVNPNRQIKTYNSYGNLSR